MSFSLLWLPQVLRDAGLKVVEVPGWQNRGHGDEGKVLGVICHHTCGPLHGDLPDLNVLKDGRPDLGGPLCQLGLGRTGTFYVIAAGKAWHAGRGQWQGIEDGNSHFIGIEAENTGETHGPRSDPWPEVQMDAYARGVAAILRHIGAKPVMCCGHKEFALPKGRKDDPSFDMAQFRQRVAQAMLSPKPLPAQTVASQEGDADEADQPASVAPADEPKPLWKSKIAQAGAAIATTEGADALSQASDAAAKVAAIKGSADQVGFFDIVGHLFTSPRFLGAVLIIAVVGGIIYWRWRDHGRGAT